jgi:hypothetical protein
LVAGYGLKSITDLVQHKWSVEKEREARKAARQDQRFERRSTFQRETLLALQDACADLSRATGHMNFLDQMANRTEQTWHRALLPEDLNEGYRLAQVRTMALSVRVRDDTIRDLVGVFRTFSTDTVTATNPAEAEQSLFRMSDAHEALNSRIGQVLREIDDDDDGSGLIHRVAHR